MTQSPTGRPWCEPKSRSPNIVSAKPVIVARYVYHIPISRCLLTKYTILTHLNWYLAQKDEVHPRTCRLRLLPCPQHPMQSHWPCHRRDLGAWWGWTNASSYRWSQEADRGPEGADRTASELSEQFIQRQSHGSSLRGISTFSSPLKPAYCIEISTFWFFILGFSANSIASRTSTLDIITIAYCDCDAFFASAVF